MLRINYSGVLPSSAVKQRNSRRHIPVSIPTIMWKCAGSCQREESARRHDGRGYKKTTEGANTLRNGHRNGSELFAHNHV